MKHIEAMELALEALEENHHLIEEHERPEYLAQYDRVISAVSKALADIKQDLTPVQETSGQAPCARHCEATAFQIVIKNLKGDIERLNAAQLAKQCPPCNHNCKQGDTCPARK
jgi:hypothetical protein